MDERLERDVAVKVIDLGGSVERVMREAQAVARLNHPSVLTLYELGEDGRSAYLVSELIDGATLTEMQRQGLLSDRDVGEAAADLSDALEHAHSRGVVHRDIKPQNVLLGADDRRAKLMDSGSPASRRSWDHRHRRHSRHARLHGAGAGRGG